MKNDESMSEPSLFINFWHYFFRSILIRTGQKNKWSKQQQQCLPQFQESYSVHLQQGLAFLAAVITAFEKLLILSQ